MISLRNKEKCKYDMISLGEVMLRLDPGETRIRNARSFQVWEGGGEYNVAKGLSRCFGMKTAIVTAFADNDIGRLIESLILEGGVDNSLIKWIPYDGIGRSVRNGLNFTERGFGIRRAVGVSDRGNTAVSKLKSGDIDWDYIFGDLGVRWFHTGGIFAALSETTSDVIIEAVKSAKKYGTIVSYDFNYRPSLWKDIGWKDKALIVNKKIAPYIDVMIGGAMDFKDCLGITSNNYADNIKPYSKEYTSLLKKVTDIYPNIKVIATTDRTVHSTTLNDWSAVVYSDGKLYKGMDFSRLEILDRVGGGDSFASGLIYGLMTYNDAQKAVNYGIAHGALTMTTPGDTSMADLHEVENIVNGGNTRVLR